MSVKKSSCYILKLDNDLNRATKMLKVNNTLLAFKSNLKLSLIIQKSKT